MILMIIKYALTNNKEIVVMTYNEKSIKPFGLARITYKDNYYLHTSMGTFFEEVGAEKYFMLAQGMEWTGGNVLDDYC